jgi:hypothetical protein
MLNTQLMLEVLLCLIKRGDSMLEIDEIVFRLPDNRMWWTIGPLHQELADSIISAQA